MRNIDSLELQPRATLTVRAKLLQDCYMSMCLTAPEVAQYEDGIQTLQNETATRKDTAKEKENEISSEGIPLFDQMLVDFSAAVFHGSTHLNWHKSLHMAESVKWTLRIA